MRVAILDDIHEAYAGTQGVQRLRSRARDVLERVARGERVTILRRGKRAAQIVPLPARGRAQRLPRLAEFRARIRVRGEALSRTVVAERDASRR